ncbi:MAG: cytochrome c-type biogenesis protein [Pseudomonadota bacterium]
MTRHRIALATLALSVALSTPAWSVQPDEILDDPILEQRAREISADLRCLVCRNESIDASHAEFARDLRLVVRERLVAGDTDAEVKDFLVDRYGEYVLLTPPFSVENAFIWLAGPAMLLMGGVLAWMTMRPGRTTRAGGPESRMDAPLDAEERAALDRLLARETDGRSEH